MTSLPIDSPALMVADFSFDNNKETSQWSEIVTDATVDANPAPTSTWVSDGYVEMLVPDDGDTVIRQSKEYFRAKGNKTIRAQFTGILNVSTTATTDPGNAGAISRVGMFDKDADKTVQVTDVGNSGFFFEYRITDGTTLGASVPTHPLYVGVRYGAETAGTDTLIRQDSFNVNDLNRLSHVSIDNWSKLYTFEIYYNAIGYVEWAIYLDGERVLLHKEQDISRVLNTIPRFNMPMRWEITNNDSTIVTGLDHEMRQFNSSVAIENGSFVNGQAQIPLTSLYKYKHLTQITSLLYTIDSTTYVPVFSFRLKGEFIRAPLRLYEVIYLIQSSNPMSIAIIRNATLSTPSPVWANAGTDSHLEYSNNSSTASSATDIIYEMFVDAAHAGKEDHGSTSIKIGPAPLLADIAGNADIFTVMARKQSVHKSFANFGLRWIQE